jgi:hypothetical protein
LKVSVRMSTNYELFEYFFRNDWCFESKKIFVILDKVSEEEKTIFNANTKTIDWRIHSQLNVYGMQKFVYRMDSKLPFYESSTLINRFNTGYFYDLQTAVEKFKKVKTFDCADLFDNILYSQRVQTEFNRQYDVQN